MGEYTRLREITGDDTSLILNWRNNPEIGSHITFSLDKLTKKKHEIFLEKYFDENMNYYFIIEELNTSKAIGTVSVDNIDVLAKKAEIGKLLLGVEHRVHVFEVYYLVQRFAFETLQLNKTYAFQQEANKACKFMEYLGAKKEGVLRQHYWNGVWCDNIVMWAMFLPDFLELKGRYERMSSAIIN